MDMISFGTVFLELVFGHLPEHPRPGEEVFTDDFAVSCGGAVTSASAAARAGIQAGLCTVLGNDLGSRVVRTHCDREGVDLMPSIQVPRRSAGITVVLNFGGDRAFVTHLPPRPAGEQPEIDRWHDVLLRERPRWCYLHARPGAPGLLRAARAAGVRVMLDTSPGEAWERDLVIECVRLADVFVPNEAELRRVTGAQTLESAVSAAAAWGTPVVVKRGAAGALVVEAGTVAEVRDGVQPVIARDLTGAGDSFAGALIAGLLRGVPLAGAVVAANQAGSEAVCRLGAVGEVEMGSGSALDELLTVAMAESSVAASIQGSRRPATGPGSGA